jgi:uncharacterized protein (TIGR02646 family)
MPFRRQPAPGFWLEKEQRYLAMRGGVSAKRALHDWQHDKLSLARWFHRTVRSADEPRLCAYCDAVLGEASPETMDHFLPEHAAPDLGLAWDNLFPACALCNSSFKRTRWSCRLLRPDRDLFRAEQGSSDLDEIRRWFYFDPVTGALGPAPGVDPVTRARVRLTLGVLRSNDAVRRTARRNRWRDLLNAAKLPVDEERLAEMANQGPYRFVALFFFAARGAPLGGDGS